VQRSLIESDRGNGHEAQALAAMSEARVGDALAHFDSAATAFGTGTAVLEAAEWRVLPDAIGWNVVPDAERMAGRSALRRFAELPELSPRACWALALDAIARQQSADAARWRARITAVNDNTADRLRVMLDAARTAAAGNPRAALQQTQQLMRYESHGDLGDPFARAALHALRARWYEEIGERERALRELLWVENQDLVGWPDGSAQAAEIDWVFDGFARARRTAITGAMAQ
jgi:hypothetical protein